MRLTSISGILFFSAFLVYTNYSCQAQDVPQIDSLINTISLETNSEGLVHKLNLIAFSYASLNIDSTLAYIERATVLAKKIEYKKGLAECYEYKARASVEIGLLTEAIQYYNHSLELNLQMGDSVNTMHVYLGLGYIYSYGTNQIKCLDYNLKALTVAEELNDSTSLSTIYNNIATIYLKTDNYNNSLFYFNKSLEIDKKIGTTRDLATTYSNIGVLKINFKKFDEAKAEYRHLKKLLPEINSLYLKSYFYTSLAGYYTAIEKFDSAFYYIENAITLSEQKNINHVKARALRRKGELFLKKGMYKESISVLKNCIELSNETGIVEEFPDIYRKIAEAQSKLQQFQDAYLSLELANKYLDSMRHNETATTLAEFEQEQQAKLEQKRNQLQEELNNQHAINDSIRLRSKLRLLGLTSAFLLISALIFSYYLLRSRKNNAILRSQHDIINKQKALLEEHINKLQLSEKSLQQVNATKDKFFSIIAHDLRSPFSAIMGFSNELSQSFESYDKEQQKQMIQLIANSSESTFFLLENLLNWARSQSNSIKLNPAKHNLLNLVEESITPYIGNAQAKKLNIKISVPEDIQTYCDKETIKVLIANLFNNAIKYTPLNGEISFNAKLNNTSSELSVSDSGIGMDENLLNCLFNFECDTQRAGTENEKGTGLGLALCKEFIELNGGKIWVSSEPGKGSTFRVSLPLPPK